MFISALILVFLYGWGWLGFSSQLWITPKVLIVLITTAVMFGSGLLAAFMLTAGLGSLTVSIAERKRAKSENLPLRLDNLRIGCLWLILCVLCYALIKLVG